MKSFAFVVFVLFSAASLLVAGCSGGSGASPGSASSGFNLLSANSGPQDSDSNGTYSVLLQVFNDPSRHIQDAQRYKDALEKTQNWRGLRIVSEADNSELYWGRFRTVEDAKPTLQKAKNYRAANGVAIFAQAIVVALPGSELGPKEWDLTTARGEYSLLVAVFENDPQSNPPYVECAKDAVDYCTQLRQQGYEAYFHHGPNKSSVTIGSFPAAAVRIEDKQAYQFGQTNPTIVHNMVVVDSKLLALQKKFPKLAFNGRELINNRRDRQGKLVSRTVAETYVVKIPHENERTQANDSFGNRQPR